MVLAMSIKSVRLDALSVATTTATPGFISSAHDRDKEVHVWTVNTTKQMGIFFDRGADNVITDYPADAVARLAERAELGDGARLLLKIRTWLWY